MQRRLRHLRWPAPHSRCFPREKGTLWCTTFGAFLFKNVLFKEGNIDEQWIYGSFVNIKVVQPDNPDENLKIKMDEKFKHGLNVELSKRSLENKESFEWIFFNDSLKVLFDNFSNKR